MHVHNLTFVTNIYKKQNTNAAKILLYKFFSAFVLFFFLYLFIENAAWGASFPLFFRHGVNASLRSILFH